MTVLPRKCILKFKRDTRMCLNPKPKIKLECVTPLKLLETYSQELLADSEQPGSINIEIHKEQPTGDEKEIQDEDKPVFKKVIQTENSIVEITRNF